MAEAYQRGWFPRNFPEWSPLGIFGQTLWKSITAEPVPPDKQVKNR